MKLFNKKKEFNINDIEIDEVTATKDELKLEDKIVIDLVRIDGIKGNVGEYDGLCW